ncbi:putative RNA recognition motif domain, nucleotide-binding alpha-beta plait domain superfamily [Helianthus annuus]|nr:putative RNA recognition motif domain, nucleotide-binding alpha-beta plait domain superfamily [Helianthus annuus]
MAGSITKLFISNLPEGSTPWELRKCLESFGEISGTFVAKKRDKFGCRFGFASFKDVSNREELLNSLRGVKMGDCRLRINIARFAVENAGMPGPKPVQVRLSGVHGQSGGNGPSNLRDSRSYSFVVGASAQGNFVNGGPPLKSGDQLLSGKSVVVPDRTAGFQELAGLALVGRTVNLETLVDFDRLLNIAKVVVANIQYIGGLSLLISFHDKDSATRFLESKKLWGPWFSRLDGWNGQSLPLERVSWLKLSGIPLHLLSSEVLGLIGELFGKVLHVPKGLEEDLDLSVCRIGVLVGEVNRISEGISLRWKNRSYRIWVEEDPNDWIPDCLRSASSSSSGEGSSPVSSPVVDGSGSDAWGNEGTLHGEGGMGDGVSVGGGGADSNVNQVPVHADSEIGCGNEGVGTGSTAVEIPCFVSKDVGPGVIGSFVCGAGERPSKPNRRRRSGLMSKKAHSSCQLDKACSPDAERPKKRPRDSDGGRGGGWRRDQDRSQREG